MAMTNSLGTVYSFGPLFFGLLFCFIIILLDLKVDLNSDEYNTEIHSSMQSLQFQFSLIASMSIAVPHAIDIFLDMLTSKLKSEKLRSDFTSYTFLISSLLLPNILIIQCALPSKSINLLACLISARSILNSTSVIRLVAEAGRPKLTGVKRSFIRFISHEVRTPLNAVKLGLDVVKHEMEVRHCSNESLETIDDVSESCTQAVTILNELLNFEKIEAGVLTLDRTVVSVWELLSKSLRPLQPQARSANVQILAPTTHSLSAETLRKTTLNIDQEKIIQVLQFLIGFALKRTPSGKSITIRANVTTGVISNNYHHSAEDQALLRLNITYSLYGTSQNGIHLFSHKSSGKHDKNNSDGLSSTLQGMKAIIDIHSGSMVIEAGTMQQTFTIELPVMQTIKTSLATLVATSTKRVIHTSSSKDNLNNITTGSSTTTSNNNNNIKNRIALSSRTHCREASLDNDINTDRNRNRNKTTAKATAGEKYNTTRVASSQNMNNENEKSRNTSDPTKLRQLFKQHRDVEDEDEMKGDNTNNIIGDTNGNCNDNDNHSENGNIHITIQDIDKELQQQHQHAILMIDDSPMSRKMLRRVLEASKEYSVITESVDGLDGLAQYETALSKGLSLLKKSVHIRSNL
eukprot:gene10727-22409_t